MAKLDALVVQKLINRKGSALCTLLYANSRPRIAGYLALARAIKDAGHLCFVVHPQKSVPSSEEIIGYEDLDIGWMSVSDVRKLQGLDVFFSSEVVFDVAPDDCATVGIFHSLPEYLRANYANAVENQPSIVRTFDYLVAAVKQRKVNWTIENYRAFVQGLYPAQFLQHRRPVLDVIPGGYPKLDYLERLAATPIEELDTIIYAPTRSILKQGQMREEASYIIDRLLRVFVNHRIVFRPYPIEEDIVFGRRVASRFSGNSRFAFDDSVTGIRHVRCCAVMVTDRSSVAVSYALSTGRPIVLTDLSADADGERGVKREIYGFITRGREEMITAVADCIANQRQWKTSIFESRKQIMYNPGEASTYLASKLRTFARRESEAGWLSIPRTPWSGEASLAERESHLRRLLERSKGGEKRAVQQAYEEIRNYLEEGALPTAVSGA